MSNDEEFTAEEIAEINRDAQAALEEYRRGETISLDDLDAETGTADDRISPEFAEAAREHLRERGRD